MQKIIDVNLIEYHFQPIISEATTTQTKVHSYEALCRYQYNGEQIRGDRIINIVKENGLLIHLDRNTVKQCSSILQNNPQMRISINLSALSLLCSEVIIDLIATKEISSRLIIEITETENIGSNKSITLKKNIAILKKIGYQIAVDDFGDGFSSITYLIKLPVDYVKISRATLKDIKSTIDEGKATMLKGIISAIKGNSIKVVFEGIENASDLLAAKSIGADYFQGYYFGKPEPLNERHTRQSDYRPIREGILSK